MADGAKAIIAEMKDAVEVLNCASFERRCVRVSIERPSHRSLRIDVMPNLRLVVIVLSLLSFSHSVSGEEQVEIYLIDPVDEERGYCIDIKGHQKKAKIQRGLQAHTCYSYQGKIAVDQAFDSLAFGENRLYLSAFDVCVSAESIRATTSLQLERCREGDELQEFSWDEKGRIRTIADPNLCITAAPGDVRKGGGGSPVHLIRRLSLERCNIALQRTQRWGFRTVGY